MIRIPLLVLALFLALGSGPDPRPPDAHAQATDSQRAFVYGVNAGVPGSFVGTFAPNDDAIYLLAGETSVISPRITEIYFWPITNEYRADWRAYNEPQPGTLEVLRGGLVVAEVESMDYTIHFRQDGSETSSELFLGEEAADAEDAFRARQQAFQEASRAYYDAERAWMDAAAEANEKRKEGETVELSPPPEPPDPIGIFSNGLNQGMPIDLQPGEYRIRLRGPDGAIVSGSERELVVFAARRIGVGYSVVPETRWTTPLESSAPSDVIYGVPGANLYLEPRLTREYPARAWALLQNPQGAGAAAGGWEWVSGERITTGSLEVLRGGQAAAELALTPYQVRQVPGTQLGYEVLPFDAAAGSNDLPEFEAFPLRLETAGEAFQIRLVSPEGEVMEGSERRVSASGRVPLTRLFVLSLAPLAIGAAVGAVRNRRVQRPGGFEG
jgi:hypothetical protein